MPYIVNNKHLVTELTPTTSLLK